MDLSQSKLADTDLSRCSFRGANLTGTSLWHTVLVGADFSFANLEEADLDMADLEGAVLKGARIKRTILPLRRVRMDRILESVRTGAKIVMERRDPDED
jgi:uncharacterized protein YjbI with pentapeptide repeats